ncbi:MAG: YDG domain-containing protein, partial [Candidatus Paceibacterota bacterium]
MKHTKQKSIGAIFSLVLALFVFGAVGINGAFAIAVINQSLLPTLNNGVFNVTATQSDIDTCVAAGGDRFSYEITQDGATFLLLQSFAFPLSALNFSYPLTSSATAYAFVCSNANNDILVPLVIIQIESVNRTFVYQPLSFSTALPIITESSWPTLNSGTFDVTAEQSDVNTCVAAGGDRFSYSSSLDGVIYQTLQSFVFPLSALNFSYPLTRSAVIYGFMCSNSSNDELIVLANVTTLFLVLSNPIYQPLLFHPYIAPTTGTPEVGSVLTAGALTPAEATVSYNWRISDTEDGTYADTSPASTTTTYIPSASEIGKYLKVVVTGTGSYSGISTSTATTVITGKQLTISDPSLTLSKIYDGNASASVTAGTLSGVIDGDEVTVTAAANYDSASGGVNKTITVAYTL